LPVIELLVRGFLQSHFSWPGVRLAFGVLGNNCSVVQLRWRSQLARCPAGQVDSLPGFAVPRQSVGNDHALTGSTQSGALRVTHDDTDQEGSRFGIEIELHSNAGFIESGERGVFELEIDRALHGGEKVAVVVEQRHDHFQVVIVAVLDTPEFQAFGVNAGDDAKAGLSVSMRDVGVSMEKVEMNWGLPLSIRRKSSFLRLATGLPCESRTTTRTWTRFTSNL
jgi:hypothetical protein